MTYTIPGEQEEERDTMKAMQAKLRFEEGREKPGLVLAATSDKETSPKRSPMNREKLPWKPNC